MAAVPRQRFLHGFTAGVALVLGTALVLVYSGTAVVIWPSAGLDADSVVLAAQWVRRNLGLSLPVFAVVLGLYLHSLVLLKQRLRAGRPVEEVAQAEHLADIWTSLFFGVGVIWTAIGMRGALLHALADPLNTSAQSGFEVLSRLVDGGILVALSTTIFGGVGGYLMRVFKALSVGADLKRFYGRVTRSQGADIQATLNRIEDCLGLAVSSTNRNNRSVHAPSALDAREPSGP